MKVTIIPSDFFCAVDDIGYSPIDMSTLPKDIHAIQWYGTYGSVEFKDDGTGNKKANQEINSTELFDNIILHWKEVDYLHKNPPPVLPTATENKAIAQQKLVLSDWSVLPDVNISNTSMFIEYRRILRNIVLNPIDGNIEWPLEPDAIWIK